MESKKKSPKEPSEGMRSVRSMIDEINTQLQHGSRENIIDTGRFVASRSSNITLPSESSAINPAELSNQQNRGSTNSEHGDEDEMSPLIAQTTTEPDPVVPRQNAENVFEEPPYEDIYLADSDVEKEPYGSNDNENSEKADPVTGLGLVVRPSRERWVLEESDEDIPQEHLYPAGSDTDNRDSGYNNNEGDFQDAGERDQEVVTHTTTRGVDRNYPGPKSRKETNSCSTLDKNSPTADLSGTRPPGSVPKNDHTNARLDHTKPKTYDYAKALQRAINEKIVRSCSYVQVTDDSESREDSKTIEETGGAVEKPSDEKVKNEEFPTGRYNCPEIKNQLHYISVEFESLNTKKKKEYIAHWDEVEAEWQARQRKENGPWERFGMRREEFFSTFKTRQEWLDALEASEQWRSAGEWITQEGEDGYEDPFASSNDEAEIDSPQEISNWGNTMRPDEDSNSQTSPPPDNTADDFTEIEKNEIENSDVQTAIDISRRESWASHTTIGERSEVIDTTLSDDGYVPGEVSNPKRFGAQSASPVSTILRSRDFEPLTETSHSEDNESRGRPREDCYGKYFESRNAEVHDSDASNDDDGNGGSLDNGSVDDRNDESEGHEKEDKTGHDSDDETSNKSKDKQDSSDSDDAGEIEESGEEEVSEESDLFDELFDSESNNDVLDVEIPITSDVIAADLEADEMEAGEAQAGRSFDGLDMNIPGVSEADWLQNEAALEQIEKDRRAQTGTDQSGTPDPRAQAGSGSQESRCGEQGRPSQYSQGSRDVGPRKPVRQKYGQGSQGHGKKASNDATSTSDFKAKGKNLKQIEDPAGNSAEARKKQKKEAKKRQRDAKRKRKAEAKKRSLEQGTEPSPPAGNAKDFRPRGRDESNSTGDKASRQDTSQDHQLENQKTGPEADEMQNSVTQIHSQAEHVIVPSTSSGIPSPASEDAGQHDAAEGSDVDKAERTPNKGAEKGV